MSRGRDARDPDASFAARIGRLALQPVWTVAHAGGGVLNAEAERAIDGVMAGPLPEAIGRALVEHLVVQRLAASALEAWGERAETATAHVLDEADLEGRLLEAVRSPRTSELAH
jgi:hypothetical protein